MGNTIKMKFLFFAAAVATVTAQQTWASETDMDTYIESTLEVSYPETVELTADSYDNTVDTMVYEGSVVIARWTESATFTLQTHTDDTDTMTNVGTLSTGHITTETPNYYMGAIVF